MGPKPSVHLLERNALKDRLELLIKNIPASMAGALIVSLAIVVYVWNHGKGYPVALWFALNLLIVVPRLWLFRVYRTKASGGDGRWKWGRWFIGLTFLAGVVWGLLPWLVLDVDMPEEMLVIMLIMFGMISGSMPSYAPVFSAYASFSVPASVGLAGKLFLEGGDNTILGILVLAFLVANLIFCWNHRGLILANIYQRIEKESLLADLEHRTMEAEKANRDKSRLLAATSHDLRQPLHALNLFLSSLEGQLTQDAQRQLLEKARMSGAALGELLNSLLDLSRLDAGEVRVEMTSFDLGGLLERCAGEFRPLAEDKGLKLRVDAESGRVVRSDPVLLARVMRNLLSNAVRYTEAGEILIRAGQRNGKAVIEVRDSGKGMAPEHLPHVFDEFFQIENPERDRDKGLGLGLAIVRRLTDLLEIAVDVESVPGKGSCFRLELPSATLPVTQDSNDAAVSRPARIRDLVGMLVMVVDDDRTILDAMRILLRGWDCEVLAAEGMDEALDEIRRHDYPAPDALLVDYRLRGEHTGIDAVRAVRAHFGRSIPAIVISGEAERDAETEARRHGLGFARKPIEAEAIARLLLKLRNGNEEEAAGA